MSANLSIATYSNPTAMTLPPSAIRNGPHGDYVLVRDAVSGETSQRPVTVGRPFEDGVEIVQGLKAGEVVVAENAAAPVSVTKGGLAAPPTGQALGTMGRL